LDQHAAVIGAGRAVLLGDHTSVVNDARRLPGVVTRHQDSATQSKPTYCRGHHGGVVGLVVGSLAPAFCLPLEARLPQGFAHVREDETDAAQRPTRAVRLIRMALQFAVRQDTPALLVLDAFCAIAPVLQRAASTWALRLKHPYLHSLPRAQKNSVAYTPAKPQDKRAAGRPRKYGDPSKLKEVFETHQAPLSNASCEVYGHVETVSYLVLKLLWKPIKAPLRFVFAITSRGPIVLRCSALARDPLMAIALYGARVRLATMFAMRKSVLGAFAYRFWSKRLPRHSRQPKKHTALKTPQKEPLETVQKTWQACERFVMLGCITLGLLQLVALKFPHQVWEAFSLFLRTRHRALPSERTVKEVLAQELGRNDRKAASYATMPLRAPGEFPEEPLAPSAPAEELFMIVHA
jgi:hypothetical protein